VMDSDPNYPYEQPPPQIPASIPPEPGSASGAPAENSSTSTALVRLLAGGTLQGSDILLARLKEWERQNPDAKDIFEAKPDETELDRGRYALIGMLLDAADILESGLSRTGRVGKTLSNLTAAPFRRVGSSLPLRPFRSGFDRLVQRGEQRMEDWTQRGRAADLRSRRMTQEVVTNSIEEVVNYFAVNEQVQVLVRGQINLLVEGIPYTPELDQLVKILAGNYIQYLQENPKVLDSMVVSVADQYIDHLHEEPEKVQDIIQGQSVGLIQTILDEIRQRLISVDEVMELVVRRILKRAPRTHLPPPPEKVQARAETGRLPEDFPQLEQP
jgi:hypothetical protein